MGNHAYREAERLKHRHETNDPFEILWELGAKVIFSPKYKRLKGFCFVSNRITYVVINDRLPVEEKRIVAAHELGHLRLHQSHLQCAFMSNEVLSRAKDNTELEANTFAADLLISDEDVVELLNEPDIDFYSAAKRLKTMPDLLAFKLQSMAHRGFQLKIPVEVRSRFLAD